MRWHRSQVSDEAHRLECLEAEVADVQLPPPEPLAGRSGIEVMVVVPTLSERDQGEPEVVPALVLGGESALAEAWRDGVDGIGRVVETKNPHPNICGPLVPRCG